MSTTQGVVTLELREAEFIDGEWVPGDIVDSLTQKNQILYDRYTQYMVSSTSTQQYSVYSNTNDTLRISEHFAEGPTNGVLNQIVGTELEQYKTNRTQTTPAYWTFKARWTPPSSTDRTIRTVMFGSNFSIISLGTAFTQSTTQILDITYRLYENESSETNTNSYPWVIPHLTYQFGFSGGQYSNDGGGYPRYLYFKPFSSNNLDLKMSRYQPWTSYSRTDGSGYSSPGGTAVSDGGVVRKTANFTSLSGDVGLLASSVFVGNGSQFTAPPTDIRKPGESAVQNTFARTPENTMPYLDVDSLATGTGVVTVDDNDSWTPDVETDFAKKYRVRITAGGNGTSATYKLSRREWTGTQGDTVTPSDFSAAKTLAVRSVDGEYMESVDGLRHSPHGQKWNNAWGYYSNEENADISLIDVHVQPYIFPEFITANSTGITLCHVAKPWHNVDKDSTIPLPVTDVRQIQHTSDGTIYVACADSGLWKIERTLGTPADSVTAITRITVPGAEDDTKCRGMQIKKSNGAFWAVFGREMCTSTDSGATWTVYNETTTPQFAIPGVTDNTQAARRIVHIHMDPNHADDRFIIARTNSQFADFDRSGGFFWWSRGGSVTAGTSDAEYRDTGCQPLTGRLLGTRAVHCTKNGQWLFNHGQSGSGEQGLFLSDFKSTTGNYAFRHSSYPDWQGFREGSIASGNGINVIEYNGEEYIVGKANNNTTPTPTNPDGINFEQWFVLFNVDDLYTEDYTAWSTPLMYPITYELSTTNDNQYFRNTTYLGEGIFLTLYQDAGYCEPMYRHASGYGTDQGESYGLWRHYGWNGSQWEEGHSGSRTVHTTREPLIDGLSITFTDEGTGSYVNNEFYDTYVYNGILKDNATTFQFATDVVLSNLFETTDFNTGSVPVTEKGLVTEDFAVMHQDRNYYNDSSTRNDTVWWWCEPGVAGGYAADNWRSSFAGEQKLVGDYSFSFRLANLTNNNSVNGIGARHYSDDLFYGNIYNSSLRGYDEFMSFSVQGTETSRTVVIRTCSGTVLHSEVMADFDIADVFTMARSSGVITYSRNGTPFYTSSITDTADHQIVCGIGTDNGDTYLSFKDMTITYTADRYYLEVGNSVSNTGAFDPDFRKLFQHATLTDLLNEINIAGAPATIHYDAYTVPAPGEVTVMPYSGKLWFNSADAGKAVTGRMKYLKRLNLSTGLTAPTNFVDMTVTVDENANANFYGGNVRYLIDGNDITNIDFVPGTTYKLDLSDPSCEGYNLRISKTPNGEGSEYTVRSVSGTPGFADAYLQFEMINDIEAMHIYDTTVQGMGTEPHDGYYDTEIAQTFAVTVAGGVFNIDGSATPTLELGEGAIYKFDQSDASNAGHPLRISLTADGTHGAGEKLEWGTQEFGTPGTAGAYTLLIPYINSPAMYYYCENHANMGGQLNTDLDGFWDNVVFLGHFEGTHGDTVFSDSSPANITVSAYGGTNISNAQAKFGITSVYFDGSNDNLTLPLPALFTGAFTLEMWVYPTAEFTSTERVLWSSYDNIDCSLRLQGDRLEFYNTEYTVNDTFDNLLPLNQWSHVAFSRDNSDRLRLHINGVNVLPVVYNGGDGSHPSSVLEIGAYNNTSYDFGGYMDEIRITARKCRYTTDTIAVPTAPFPEQ